MANVAFVTDSASDLDPAVAAAAGIGVIPLLVNFGKESFKAGVELSTADFWEAHGGPGRAVPDHGCLVAG